MIPNYLKRHAMFSESDYRYLAGKGYTNREILAIWNRDSAAGKSPLTHVKAPNLLPQSPLAK